MRRDMSKVIVERPRAQPYGGGGGRRANRPQDELPHYERMKALKGGTKELNENLAPLRRFIHQQVGRPWNAVYSEIRENIKPGNTVQEHVLSHVDNFITRHVERVPPSAKFPTGLVAKPGVRHVWSTSLREGDLYVDKDGIIKVAKKRFHAVEPAKNRRAAILDGTRILARDNGIWYSVELQRYKLESYRVTVPWVSSRRPDAKPTTIQQTRNRFVLPDETRVDEILDGLRGRIKADETLNLERIYGAKGVYGRYGTKKQVSAHTLKRLGIKNDA